MTLVKALSFSSAQLTSLSRGREGLLTILRLQGPRAVLVDHRFALYHHGLVFPILHVPFLQVVSNYLESDSMLDLCSCIFLLFTY